MLKYSVINKRGLRVRTAPTIFSHTTRKLSAGDIVAVKDVVKIGADQWALLHSDNPNAESEYCAIKYKRKEYMQKINDEKPNTIQAWAEDIDEWARREGFNGTHLP